MHVESKLYLSEDATITVLNHGDETVTLEIQLVNEEPMNVWMELNEAEELSTLLLAAVRREKAHVNTN